MRRLIIPENYSSKLSLRDTQYAIKFIKDNFQKKLAKALNLQRISAPIIVMSDTGINDDLNGVERKVKFSMLNMQGEAEVVQSLAKWKRTALHKYGFENGEGLYTDMNAIRRDDDVDNLHSIFVDQWDWEKVISKEDRNIEFLKDTVREIAKAVYDTKQELNKEYPQLENNFSEEVFFITTQELEDMYPDKTAKERENLITEKHKTVFLMKIGGVLKSGEKHDGRAPDYDDWELNGDILMWNDTLKCSFEISSMGIRVDKDTLMKQLKIADMKERSKFEYHQGILNNTLPLTIGGGIGQSRLCMIMAEKAHIGEVHCSVWPEEMKSKCKNGNIFLL